MDGWATTLHTSAAVLTAVLGEANGKSGFPLACPPAFPSQSRVQLRALPGFADGSLSFHVPLGVHT